MKALRLGKDIQFSRSRLSFQTTMSSRNVDMPTYELRAVWFLQVQYQPLFRALFRVPFKDTGICSYMPEYQCRIQSRLGLGDSKLHTYNTETTHAIRDLYLANQQALKRGMTVPESQQPLPQIAAPEVQQRITRKHIHQ